MNNSNGWYPQTANQIPNQQQGRSYTQQGQMQTQSAQYMPPNIPEGIVRNYVLDLVVRLNPGFMIPPREDFSSEELQGTFQQLLSGNLGSYMIGEFLIGTSGIETKEGFLVGVGRSFILLYDFNARSFIMCDAFALKFATFPYLDAASIQRYIPRRYLVELDRVNGSNFSAQQNG